MKNILAKLNKLRILLLLLSIINVNSLPQDQGLLIDQNATNTNSTLLDNPLEIEVHFFLHHATINQDDHEMTLTMDIIEEWAKQKHDQDHQSSNSIAQPETDTNNEKGVTRISDESNGKLPHEITLANTGESTVLKSQTRFIKNGRILRLTKLQINTPCILNYFYFPFDKQTCSLKFLPGGLSDKDAKLTTSQTSVPAKLQEIDDISLYSLRKYRINQIFMNDNFGVFNQSGIELQLMFVRQAERSFPFLYFPVIALMVVSFMALYVKSTLNSIYLTLASFLTMIIWVVGCQSTVSHTGFTTLLDHYHFLCLNLSLNAVTVSIMLHLYLQNGSKVSSNSDSEHSGTLLDDVKLELNDIPTIITTNEPKTISNDSNGEVQRAHTENDAEAHIYRMGKIKQLIYFKSVKPAKRHQPIMFVVINIIYWTWVLIARLYVPSGFEKF